MSTAPLTQGSHGPRVVELKHMLEAWGKMHTLPEPIAQTPVFGTATAAAVKAFQSAHGLAPDGKVGDLTWADLQVAIAVHGAKQVPPLPAVFSHPNVPPYISGGGWNGLQPWIAPQAKAICVHFGLQVTAGFGGHPPHDEHSDHGWGGAVDFAGPAQAMIDCNLWADRYCSDPHKPGMIFRWVGGPAHDANGPEPGHLTHVHLSWYRSGPATSIFDTREFR
jgi:putative peptidoglycan binding protein